MGTSFSSTFAGHAPVEEDTDDEEEIQCKVESPSTKTTTRKRKQTDFLSPTFTPQKRNRDDTNTTSARGSSKGSSSKSSSTSPKVFVKYERQWENNLNLLLQYKQVHGNCQVPPSYRVTTATNGNNDNDDGSNSVALGKWLENQKQFYKRDKLSDERFIKLYNLGVEFGKKKSIEEEEEEEDSDTYDDENTTDNNTASGFFGTLFSPKKSPSSKSSSPKQPKSEKESKSPSKSSSSPKLKLSWEEYRQQLISYKNQHDGNCNIPSSDKDNKQLSKWCENQKMFHRQNKLSTERIKLLVEIGFEFTASKEERFKTHFQHLVEYKSEFGNCNVPQKHPTLGRWVNKQRTKYNEKRLSRKQYDMLESVGFCWDGKAVAES